MKAILDNIMLSMISLLDTETDLTLNEEVINHHEDYVSVNRIYDIYRNQAPEVLTEILDRLQLSNKEFSGGKYTVIRLYGDLYDARTHPTFYSALYKYYQSEKVDTLIIKLKELAAERKELLTRLLDAA